MLAALTTAATVALVPTAASADVRVPAEAATGCSGQVPVVVASDERAQSDIYSAVTLAGVLGTDCIVLAGPRDGTMVAAQRARLNEAQGGGWIVGGTASVPEAKTAGRDMKRLAGQDRWHTARLVGAVAADPDGDISELTSQTAPSEAPTAEPLPQIRKGAIAAGKSHTCALRADSTVTCWGDSRYGQTRAPEGTFTSVEATRNNSFAIRTDNTLECWGNLQACEARTPSGSYVAIDASMGHACGILSDATVECWDFDFHRDEVNSPSGTFIDVSAATRYSCGIRTDQTIACWGTVADGDTLEAPSGTYTSVEVGSFWACAIGTDQSIKCWDKHQGPEPPPGGGVSLSCADGHGKSYACGAGALTAILEGKFTDISASEDHACALRIDGTVVCGGDNTWGQSDAPEGRYTAVAVGDHHSCAIRADLSSACWGDEQSQTDPPAGDYTRVDAHGMHSCAIDTNGMIVCWGQNEHGQVNSPDGTYTAMATGRIHACAISTDLEIACWGNEFARQGEPSGTFTAVAANQHSCAISTDKTVACWGENITGRTDAPSGSYTAVALGSFHSCAIRTDRTVKCWGANDASDRSHGSRLGYGQATPRSDTYAAIAAGRQHTCAIRTSGAIACWGQAWGPWGQDKPPSGKFTAIAIGDSHSCAIRTDGTIACWGDNQHGKATPPSGTYTSVAAGEAHSCAIRTNGAIACWGQGGYGHTKPPKGAFGLVIERPTPTTPSSHGARIPAADARGECSGDTVAVVVASDLPAQSDIYSAVTLAGVLGDACIVLAGARGEPMSASEQARLDAAAPNGYVVGGTTAVPDAKLVGKNMKRIGGKDRWATARLVGEEASEPAA